MTINVLYVFSTHSLSWPSLITRPSFAARNLISKVLVPDPQQRARISDLKQHSWFTKGGSEPSVSPTTPAHLPRPPNPSNNNATNNAAADGSVKARGSEKEHSGVRYAGTSALSTMHCLLHC